MRRLIVCADDLGIAKCVNEGIIKAYREGIVSAVNFMPSGDAFDDAARLAGEAGIKEAGVHLALTESGPVLSPGSIKSLVSGSGRFRSHHNQFLAGFYLGLVDRRQIVAELSAQIRRVRDLGIRITAISSHEHIHMMPPILKIFMALAKDFSIPYIRCLKPERHGTRFGIRQLYRSLILACAGSAMETTIKGGGFMTADHFLGFVDSGRIGEEGLMGMIATLEDGVTELVTHPGFLGPEVTDRYRFHINCERELFALTSPRVKKALAANNVELIGYGGCAV